MSLGMRLGKNLGMRWETWGEPGNETWGEPGNETWEEPGNEDFEKTWDWGLI